MYADRFVKALNRDVRERESRYYSEIARALFVADEVYSAAYVRKPAAFAKAVKERLKQ